MGSGSSKQTSEQRVSYSADEVIKPMIENIFNKKIKVHSICILLKNHNFHILDKIRIVLLKYLTLNQNISSNEFNRLASILDFVNETMQIQYINNINREPSHYYPSNNELVNENPPPRYTEG